MAADNWTVYVPDRSTPITLDRCTFPTVESVRQVLSNNGHTSVGSANATQEGTTIRFSRPEGGRKGL